MIILGLGCNLGDRLGNLRETLKYLHQIDGLKIQEVSPIYQSEALLLENSPKEWNIPYLNAAVSCETKFTPDVLFAKLQEIEIKMGRSEHLKWSPRTIDIDILAWHDEFYNTEKLHIPHCELLERPFAMWPLADLQPDWKYCVPNNEATGKTAKEIIKKWDARLPHQINHRIDTPEMVGILNVTPDSFSDGGLYFDLDKALGHANELFLAGADIIDIGAESTRPGANKNILLPQEEEWQRLKPVLEGLSSLWKNAMFKPKISVDTRNPETAKKALKFNIDFINDQTGFSNPKMCEAVKESTAKLVFMHSLSLPASNKDKILDESKDAGEQVYAWAEKQIERLINFGIKKERLILDVGIGFGKSQDQSFSLIKNIASFKELGVPLYVGHSRKSFLNRFTTKGFSERDLETAVISEFLAQQKVDYLRVHNVEFNMRALKIAAALN